MMAGPLPLTSTGLAPLVTDGAGTNTDSCPNVSVPTLTFRQSAARLSSVWPITQRWDVASENDVATLKIAS